MLNFLLSPVYLIDTLEPLLPWFAIGLIVGVIITLVSTYFTDKALFAKVIKKTIIGVALIALVIGITLLVMEICKKYDQAYLEENWVSLDVIPYVFIPVLATLFISLVSGVTLFILSKKSYAKIRRAFTIVGIIVGACIVATLVLIGIYYGKNISDDGYYSEYLNSVALYVCAVLLIVFTVVIALLLGRKDKKPFDTRCIATAGIMVALSFCLSYVKLWDMPTGGSVTLVSLLPIMLFAFIYGTKKGLLVGLLYGTLQAIQDPWLIHPAQFLLDYPIAFSMVCFAGLCTDLKLFENLPQLKFGLSALVAGTMRFICHVLSGVFAFGAYANDAGATNHLTYSLVYNVYVFIDIALVIIAGIFILSSRSTAKQLTSINK